MKKLYMTACILSYLTGPALAQSCCGPDYYRAQRQENIMRDNLRAQERQADSLRQIERYEHDRNLREDRQMRIDNRDRRDNYRR